jgi:hypothetical protein
MNCEQYYIFMQQNYNDNIIFIIIKITIKCMN